MALHYAVRPAWTCADCGLEWPCPPRREQLAGEYVSARVPLMLYLAACFAEACDGLPQESVSGLYARFLLWPRSSSAHGA
jgi:hypothetical protein